MRLRSSFSAVRYVPALVLLVVAFATVAHRRNDAEKIELHRRTVVEDRLGRSSGLLVVRLTFWDAVAAASF